VSADDIALWLIRFGAPAQTLFVVVYGLWSPWWRTQTGRAIFTKGLSVALLLDLSLLAAAVGPYTGHQIVALAVISLVALGAWMQLIALLHEKFRARKSTNGFGQF
jgi:hypothetical protein